MHFLVSFLGLLWIGSVLVFRRGIEFVRYRESLQVDIQRSLKLPVPNGWNSLPPQRLNYRAYQEGLQDGRKAQWPNRRDGNRGKTSGARTEYLFGFGGQRGAGSDDPWCRLVHLLQNLTNVDQKGSSEIG
jgi:hypothetical protein